MNIKTFKMFEEESLILDTKQKVKEWLNLMDIENYTINDDLTVDVDGNVDLSGQNFERIPVKFGKVKGIFYCTYCPNLVSLEGSPVEVGKDFNCYNCPNLTSLEGCSIKVCKDFSCSTCLKLTSLKGAPSKVNGSFYCYECPELVSLEGAPEKVGKDFNCYNCPNLTSLEGFPKELNRITCKRTPFENLFNNDFKDFAKMNNREKENFIIEAFKENRIDERVFKANVSKEKQFAYKGLVSGKKFGI